MAYRIRRKERVGEAVRRIMRAQLRAAIEAAKGGAAHGLAPGTQEDRVHEVRTRLKRARAALALVRRSSGAAARDDRRLRRIAKRLARPRDLAVQAHTFRVLGTRLSAEIPGGVVRQLGRVERELRRDLGPQDVERELRRCARALRKARRRVGGWPPSGGGRVVGRGIAQTYRKARRALRVAIAEPTPERFHDWRKQVKRLAYQLRLVERAVPELTTTLVPKIDRLGEVLGQVHDLDCAKATLDLHPRWLSGRTGGGGQAVPALLEEKRAALEREALALAEAVFAGRARDVREVVEVGWRVWRQVGGGGDGAEAEEDEPAGAGGPGPGQHPAQAA